MAGSDYPKLPDSTVTLQNGEGYLFLIPDKPDWVVVNKNVASLLALCDGKHSLEDIKKIVGSHPATDEAMQVLNQLIAANFFDEVVVNRKKKPYALSSLHLNMTDKCNLKCVYCYADDRKATKDYLSLDEYRQLIDDVAQINRDVIITFTGGEPLLNKDTVELAEYCKSKNLKTFLLTNGIPITKSNVEKIASVFDEIRISLDGNTAETHDKQRGAGSYEKTTKAIALLEKAGKTPMVAMTVTNWNMHEIQDLALRFGSRLTFQPLFKAGRARGKNEINIDGITYYKALKNASGVEPYSQLGLKLLSLRNHGCMKCSVGDGEISISPSGNVYPCHMLHVDEFCAGNIRQTSFKDIYYGSEILKNIRSLSVYTREGCKECPVKLLCGGGCWARAYFSNKNLNSADDFCDYELSAFTDGLFSHVQF